MVRKVVVDPRKSLLSSILCTRREDRQRVLVCRDEESDSEAAAVSKRRKGKYSKYFAAGWITMLFGGRPQNLVANQTSVVNLICTLPVACNLGSLVIGLWAAEMAVGHAIDSSACLFFVLVSDDICKENKKET